jgi:hypothetical protein
LSIESIVSALDAEIAKLQKARTILARGGKIDAIVNQDVTFVGTVKKRKKAKMSQEARARIAEAQKKRWAKSKKAAKKAAVAPVAAPVA